MNILAWIAKTKPCRVYALIKRVFIRLFSRGLWTWPPRVICAPAFNHKIENASHSRVSVVLLFTKSYKWKKQRWKKPITRRLLFETMCFWRCPTVRQLKVADRRMGSQQKLRLIDVAWQCSDYSLLFPCSISFAESFVTCLRNRAHVYLLTYFAPCATKICSILQTP